MREHPPGSLEEARGLFPHHLDTIVMCPRRGEPGDPRTFTLADHTAAW